MFLLNLLRQRVYAINKRLEFSRNHFHFAPFQSLASPLVQAEVENKMKQKIKRKHLYFQPTSRQYATTCLHQGENS